MSSRKIGVLVSGRGSNLQSVLDRIADGYLPLEIAVVISDKADAYALERAEKAGIAAVVKNVFLRKSLKARLMQLCALMVQNLLF